MVCGCSFVRWDLQSVVTLDAVDGDSNSKSHIALKRIQSPVILLYCSKDEAVWVFLSSYFLTCFLAVFLLTLLFNRYILEEARSLGLIGAGYIWIASSLTTGNPDLTPEVFMLLSNSRRAASVWRIFYIAVVVQHDEILLTVFSVFVVKSYPFISVFIVFEGNDILLVSWFFLAWWDFSVLVNSYWKLEGKCVKITLIGCCIMLYCL